MDMRFYELYQKFRSATDDTAAELLPFDEFASLCREMELADTASDNWLRSADDCIHAISESPQLFAHGISRWLTQDDFKALAKAVAHKASVRHLQEGVPVVYDLSSIPEAQAILVGYRLCALAVAPAVSLGWTLSIAALPAPTVAITSAVENLLKYLVEEQPSTTLRLLSSKDSEFSSLAIATEVREALQAQADWLEQQPNLREFAMTMEMRLAFWSLRRNEGRDINRRAQRASVLYSLFKSQHFKYANRTSIEFAVGGQIHETTLKMAPYDVSVELPLSEHFDPVAGRQARNRLWQGPPQ